MNADGPGRRRETCVAARAQVCGGMPIAVRFAAARAVGVFLGFCAVVPADEALTDPGKLPEAAASSPAAVDWLTQSGGFPAVLGQTAAGKTVVLGNGLLRREWRIEPGVATVSLRDETTGHEFLRATGPEAFVTLGGKEYAVGGLSGQRSTNFLAAAEIAGLKPVEGSFRLERMSSGPVRERFAWKRHASWISQDAAWPPAGKEVVFHYRGPEGTPAAGVMVEVHYELYDGLPCMGKWLTVTNGSGAPVMLDAFRLETLRVTEADADVEDPWRFAVPPLHVETDFTTGAMSNAAAQKGIVVGTYSLLSSRRISDEHDVINPQTGKPGGFAKFGNAPCLCSQWGLDHFAQLRRNLTAAGFLVHEHDGSYPGDPCASAAHPGHKGFADSRWNQWEQITRYYQWCRAEGIYLNVPDWYFLHGSSRNSMGYREDNWSLPRAMQEIIERQNITDGTRYKLPSMGWMHLPLTQYHGGGAAATYEPLAEHRADYALRLASLLGGGVTGVVRGTRLYDSAETLEVVRREVAFYKAHRAILDSALLPLRRADGRDWDGWIHVNPALPEAALAMLFNSLEEPLTRRITLPMRYAGLKGQATVRINGGEPKTVTLNAAGETVLELTLAGRSATSVTVTR